MKKERSGDDLNGMGVDDEEACGDGGRRGHCAADARLRKTPLEKFGDRSEVKRCIESGRPQYCGIFTDRDRMALVLSSPSLPFGNVFFMMLWNRYVYDKRLSKPVGIGGVNFWLLSSSSQWK